MSAIRIAPSILSADFARLGEEVRAIEAAGADLVHFDVMDNHYVPNLTIGPLVCEAIRPHVRIGIDVHLMVEPVDALIPLFAKAGANLISFHPEASRHVDRTLQLIRDHGCKAGLVFNPATPLAHMDNVLDKLDLVLLMSEARAQGLQLAIATTTSPVNIAALLRTAIGPDWRGHFLAVGDASNAPIKKPHPQVYMKVLADLGFRAADCVAFEDSSNGLRAATAAGLKTVITPNRVTAHHDFKGALRTVTDLTQVSVPRLREWHAQ